MEKIVKDGRVFISSTMLEGRFMLRLAVLSFRTHLPVINTLLSLLKEKSEMLEKEKIIYGQAQIQLAMPLNMAKSRMP